MPKPFAEMTQIELIVAYGIAESDDGAIDEKHHYGEREPNERPATDEFDCDDRYYRRM